MQIPEPVAIWHYERFFLALDMSCCQESPGAVKPALLSDPSVSLRSSSPISSSFRQYHGEKKKKSYKEDFLDMTFICVFVCACVRLLVCFCQNKNSRPST